MSIKRILTAGAAALTLMTSTAAFAHDWDHDGRRDNGWHERHDHDGWRDRDWHGHDRYWRPGYRAFMPRAHFYGVVAAHGYRYVGAPYFYHGRYVVRAHDRFGRVVFVEMNPYTGGYIGLVRF